MNTTQPTSARFEQALQQSVQWIRTHQEQFWAIAGTVIGGVFLSVFLIKRHQTVNDEAWTQLGVAQGYLLQGQSVPAKKALDEWFGRYQGTGAASYAKFMRADLLYKTSDYVNAAQVYSDLSQTGQPPIVRPLALSGLCASYEMAGKLSEAQAATQQFLEKYPDHFLTPTLYLTQARLAEMSGQNAEASKVYDRFVILYPQSPWTPLVRSRLQALSSPSTPILKK